MFDEGEEFKPGLKAQQVWDLFRDYHPSMRKALFLRTKQMLTEHTRNNPGDSVIFEKLPYIGAAGNRVPANEIGRHFHNQVKYLESHSQGIDYDTITVEELLYYGFTQVRIKNFIRVYNIPQYFRHHIFHRAKSLLVQDLNNSDVFIRIETDSMASLSNAVQAGNSRIFLLPGIVKE